eukprot:203856-Amphidinium_carterae.1
MAADIDCAYRVAIEGADSRMHSTSLTWQRQKNYFDGCYLSSIRTKHLQGCWSVSRCKLLVRENCASVSIRDSLCDGSLEH